MTFSQYEKELGLPINVNMGSRKLFLYREARRVRIVAAMIGGMNGKRLRPRHMDSKIPKLPQNTRKRGQHLLGSINEDARTTT
jgi:hypothetical protein